MQDNYLYKTAYYREFFLTLLFYFIADYSSSLVCRMNTVDKMLLTILYFYFMMLLPTHFYYSIKCTESDVSGATGGNLSR
ncbi:hypothetical protein CU079_06695 [Citrobacter freundii]|nr:hypothetical protein CU079_06695 [Citrobacter freundii]